TTLFRSQRSRRRSGKKISREASGASRAAEPEAERQKDFARGERGEPSSGAGGGAAKRFRARRAGRAEQRSRRRSGKKIESLADENVSAGSDTQRRPLRPPGHREIGRAHV